MRLHGCALRGDYHQLHAGDPDGPGLMSLNYNGVIALLVNAVKELSAKVDALEKKAAG